MKLTSHNFASHVNQGQLFDSLCDKVNKMADDTCAKCSASRDVGTVALDSDHEEIGKLIGKGSGSDTETWSYSSAKDAPRSPKGRAEQSGSS
ncbi:hypothetical protein FGRMN_10522 [Fusarium graminum]|nr:hypothetical protein FGRMN_10522 [Fusarium graminum]